MLTQPFNNLIEQDSWNEWRVPERFLLENRAEVLSVMGIDMTFEKREKIIRKEEREEGREEGRLIGEKEGRIENAISNIRALMKNMNWTADQAMNALGIAEEDRAIYMSRL